MQNLSLKKDVAKIDNWASGASPPIGFNITVRRGYAHAQILRASTNIGRGPVVQFTSNDTHCFCSQR